MIQIRTLVLGPLQANCYLLADPSGRAAVVDPGGEAPTIIDTLRRANWTPEVVINTHGHIDHIAANRPLVEHYQVPLLIHRLDAPFLTDPALNLSSWGLGSLDSPPPDRVLADGDEINLGELNLRVIATPGHSPGSISLLGQEGEVLLTGDTLFAGSVGRTDLPGGDYDQLAASIRDRLLTLPDATRIYPGHGPESTIGRERRSNPFIAQIFAGGGWI